MLREELEVVEKRESNLTLQLSSLSKQLTELSKVIASDRAILNSHIGVSEKIISLNTEIENFGETLIANEALRQVIEPQIKSREEEIKEILFHFKEGNLDQANDLHTIEQLVTEAENIKSEISNFKNTLRANPALSAVILPQLDIRIKRRDELLSVISLKQNSEFMKISVEKMDEVKYLLDQKISNLEVSLASNFPTIRTY